MTEQAVDVIVPVLNGGPRLRECLQGVVRQEGVTARLIVVDNGSLDGSPDVAREYGATVLTESRRSSYAARNAGLRLVHAPIVAFTDADCVPSATWLAAAVCAMEEHQLDLCAGRIDFEPATTAAGRHDSLTYLDQERYVAWGFAATANLLVRTEVMDALGGFRADLVSGGDMELTRRAVAAGYRLGYAADAVLMHPPRDTLRGVLRKAWRIGLGHGAMARDDSVARRKWFSVRSLRPAAVVREADDWQVLGVEMAVRLTAYTARRVGFRRALPARVAPTD